MPDQAKALFLDRDGVINEDREYVHKREDFVFREGIFDVCRYFQEKGFLIFVITNQSGIGRGYFTEKDFQKLNRWMLEEFSKKGIEIQKVYYCPYHPEFGVGHYKKKSEDRKPKPGMVLKAQKEFNLNLSQSVLIGDKPEDIQCGKTAGVGTNILVKSKYYQSGTLADFEVGGLMDIITLPAVS